MLFVVQFDDVYFDHAERLPEPERDLHMEAHLTYLAFWCPSFMDCMAERGTGEI